MLQVAATGTEEEERFSPLKTNNMNIHALRVFMQT
jgi:hypothetical protein